MDHDEFGPAPDPTARWRAAQVQQEAEFTRARVRRKLAESRERQAAQQSAGESEKVRVLEQQMAFALENLAAVAHVVETTLTTLDDKITKLERVLTRSELESQKTFTDLFARLDSVRQDLQQSPKPAHQLRAVN
jgi:hypothetical protein